MPNWDEAGLSEPQRRWFASVREGLERDTGRSLDAWVELARACPETKHRARLAWMKASHGLGQNRASMVLGYAFPPGEPICGTDDDPLWTDPGARAVFEAVRQRASALDGVVVGRRKGYTAFSRRWQFAAVRPLKGGGVRLGLALDAGDARLGPPRNEPWSERLTAVVDLASILTVDDEVGAWLKQAWTRS